MCRKMKTYFMRPIIVFGVIGLAIMLVGCSKDDEEETTDSVATTNSASLIGQNWATLNGTIRPGGLTYVVVFDYDTANAVSFRYFVTGIPDTISGDASAAASAVITGLSAGTSYNFRIKAINGNDTSYADEVTFTTTNPGKSVINYKGNMAYRSVIDIDGNVYKTILIGTQIWMAENLKTTRYNDNNLIPFISGSSDWTALSTPGYCWYNNDSIVYGALYNWHAVSTNKLCPSGWHIPTNDEWMTFASFLGDENSVAGKIKEEGAIHWQSSVYISTNESGFTALPGGYRSYTGDYGSIKRYGFFWSSTEKVSSDGYCRILFYNFNTFNRTSSIKRSGLSVRCIKD
jgi:uncharacterized protein (TIGR02145 family)